MGAVLDQAVTELNGRLTGRSFAGTAKFVLTGEGSIVVDASGARLGDEDADVTLTATPDTFQSIIAGDMDAAQAFMTGKLSLEGDMGKAMALAQILA